MVKQTRPTGPALTRPYLARPSTAQPDGLSASACSVPCLGLNPGPWHGTANRPPRVRHESRTKNSPLTLPNLPTARKTHTNHNLIFSPPPHLTLLHLDSARHTASATRPRLPHLQPSTHGHTTQKPCPPSLLAPDRRRLPRPPPAVNGIHKQNDQVDTAIQRDWVCKRRDDHKERKRNELDSNQH